MHWFPFIQADLKPSHLPIPHSNSANPRVGLLFIIPGFDDTMGVNGQATLVNDPEILKSMSFNDRIPKLAIVVKVNEVFIHCAKAFWRSHLWSYGDSESYYALVAGFTRLQE